MWLRRGGKPFLEVITAGAFFYHLPNVAALINSTCVCASPLLVLSPQAVCYHRIMLTCSTVACQTLKLYYWNKSPNQMTPRTEEWCRLTAQKGFVYAVKLDVAWKVAFLIFVIVSFQILLQVGVLSWTVISLIVGLFRWRMMKGGGKKYSKP